jgi:hypothetical protein
MYRLKSEAFHGWDFFAKPINNFHGNGSVGPRQGAFVFVGDTIGNLPGKLVAGATVSP